MEQYPAAKHKVYLALGIVIVITIAGLFPSLLNSWSYFDDMTLVLHNVLIRDFSWSNLKEMFVTTKYEHYLMPFVHLSFAFDWALWQDEAFGYHLTNLVFHVINSLLVFALIMKLSNKNLLASFVASTLFAIHPLHVESVAWIAQRKDQVVAFFFIQAIIYYLFYIENRKRHCYALAIITFIAALLSKPVAVTIPVIFILCDYRHEGQLRLRHVLSKIPLFLVSAAFAILTIILQKESIGTFGRSPFGLTSFLVACKGYLAYIWKTILPIKLSLLYPYPTEVSFKSPEYFIPPIVLAGLFFLLYRIRRKNRAVFFYSVFFFVVMLPMIQLIPVGMVYIGDRFHYIPSIGLFGLAGIAFAKLLALCKERKFLESALIAFLAVIIGVFSYLTFRRCAVWKNSLSVREDVTRNFPDFFVGRNNLGQEYLRLASTDPDEKRRRVYLQKAEREFQESLRIVPNNYFALVGLGRTYWQMKEYEKAETLIQSALAADPYYLECYMHLGELYQEQEEYEMAIRQYSKAIEIDSKDFRYYLERGGCYDKLGQYEMAIQDYKRAASLEPRSEPAFFNMGSAYISLEKYEAAEKSLLKVIELKTGYVIEAYVNLAYVYQKMGRFQQAIRICRMLIQNNTSPIIAYERLGKIYVDMKEYQKARQAFKKALALNPPPPRRKIIQDALEKIEER